MGAYGEYLAALKEHMSGGGNAQEFTNTYISPTEQASSVGQAAIGTRPSTSANYSSSNAGNRYNVNPLVSSLKSGNIMIRGKDGTVSKAKTSKEAVNKSSEYYKKGLAKRTGTDDGSSSPISGRNVVMGKTDGGVVTTDDGGHDAFKFWTAADDHNSRVAQIRSNDSLWERGSQQFGDPRTDYASGGMYTGYGDAYTNMHQKKIDELVAAYQNSMGTDNAVQIDKGAAENSAYASSIKDSPVNNGGARVVNDGSSIIQLNSDGSITITESFSGASDTIQPGTSRYDAMMQVYFN